MANKQVVKPEVLGKRVFKQSDSLTGVKVEEKFSDEGINALKKDKNVQELMEE